MISRCFLAPILSVSNDKSEMNRLLSRLRQIESESQFNSIGLLIESMGKCIKTPSMGAQRSPQWQTDIVGRSGWSVSPGVLAVKLAAQEALSQPKAFRKIDGLRKRISSSLPSVHSLRQNELCASMTQESFKPHWEKPSLLVCCSSNTVQNHRLQPKPLCNSLEKKIPSFFLERSEKRPKCWLFLSQLSFFFITES